MNPHAGNVLKGLLRVFTLGSPIFFNYNQTVSVNGVEIHSAQLSRSGLGRQLLKNGSSVFVRVISDKGGGKYEGSVAGVRVNITSACPLKAGETFLASINAKDGTIYLTPKDAAAAAMTMSFSEVQESGLMAFLAASGLPSDQVSVSVLQLLKQMGLKIDAGLISKIRNLALHFSGKEKGAAELLTILSEKGLEASEEEIQQLLFMLEGSYDRDEENASQQKADKDSFINRINAKSGAWYLLPFELVQFTDGDLEQKKVVGGGCIRLLFDSARVLKRLNLETAFNNQKYIFSLAYEGKKLTSVHFNVSEAESAEEEIMRLKKHLMAADVTAGEVNWSDAEAVEGAASGLESFYAFGGEV